MGSNWIDISNDLADECNQDLQVYPLKEITNSIRTKNNPDKFAGVFIKWFLNDVFQDVFLIEIDIGYAHGLQVIQTGNIR